MLILASIYIGLLIIVFAVGYILGSIPSGLLLGKWLWNIDLREHGSHNIGATNAWRTLGKVPGIIVFLADFVKGALAVYIGTALMATVSPLGGVVGGMAAIIGHTFSLFLGFKGGKGVATAIGVISMLMPKLTVILFVVWFVIVYISRYVSLGSIIAGVLAPILAYSFSYPPEYIIFALLAAVLVIVRHRENIKRLMTGTENKIIEVNK